MNGSMTWDLARYMAGRIIDESSNRDKQIELIYLRAYSRPPTAEEIKIGVAAIQDFEKQWPARLGTDNDPAPRAESARWLALANYCHAILNSAEFSFID